MGNRLIVPEKIDCGYFDGSAFLGKDVSDERLVEKFEIEFYLDDAKSVYLNKKKYNIKKNHILIAKPGTLRYSELPFKTLYIKFYANELIEKLLNNLPDYFPVVRANRIKSLFEEFIELNEQTQPNTLLASSKLLALIDYIVRDTKNDDLNINYEFIKNAKKFIEQNFYKKIGLDDIASSVNLSSTYFHNIFTAATGISPHRYLIDTRIANAKKLLWNPETTMNEVAEKSGFGSQQYLNLIFKKETGVTPGKYRSDFLNRFLK